MIRRLLIFVPLGLLAALLLVLLVFITWNWIYVRSFPPILPGFYAKEFCSCRFVMQQNDGYCRVYARQWLPISSLTVDEAARRITVTGLLVTRSARWISDREGCRLED